MKHNNPKFLYNNIHIAPQPENEMDTENISQEKTVLLNITIAYLMK